MKREGRNPAHFHASILSMMKDEGPFLLEWLAYHQHIGFDQVSVYTNKCNDGTDDMLRRLEEMGLARHYRNDVPAGKKPQPHALGLATANPDIRDTDWLIVMDADEFLSVKLKQGRITDLIDALPHATDGIALTWRYFGSSGLTDWNPGLVTENYTHAAPDSFHKGWGVKTLFRPFEHMRLGIHRPHVKSAGGKPELAQLLQDQNWVNGSGKALDKTFITSGWRSTEQSLGYAWAEMNHYGVKSREAYLLRQIRGNVNNKADKYNAAYFSIFDRNEIEAPNIQRQLPKVKATIAQWLEDPRLRKLQDEALDYHRTQVAQLRSAPEYNGLIAELDQAGDIPIDRLNEVLYIQHMPPAAQEKVRKLQASGMADRDIALMVDAAIKRYVANQETQTGEDSPEAPET